MSIAGFCVMYFVQINKPKLICIKLIRTVIGSGVWRLAFFEYIRIVNYSVKIFYSYLAFLRSACANVP
jgi:hypothetical protein